MFGLLVPMLLMKQALTQPNPPERWTLAGKSIRWSPKETDGPHEDSIEASGLSTSLILKYGTKEGNRFFREIRGVWPQLRTIPNNTHGSFQYGFNNSDLPQLLVDGKVNEEVLSSASLDGTIRFETQAGPVRIERILTPSTTQPCIVESVKVTNASSSRVKIEFSKTGFEVESDPQKSVNGPFKVQVKVAKEGGSILDPGKSLETGLIFTAFRASEPAPAVSLKKEVQARIARVESIKSTLVLKTPAAELNQMFGMAKVRAIESIFQTKNGKIHCPGGGPYYAAIWANDQAEYSGPLFGMVDDAVAQEAGATAYHWFAKWINDDYKPIPSSIVAEGESFWNGAGDRGDMAMIAYGATRYVLAKGDRAEAERLWPLISWCLEYLKRKTTVEGVIASDSDELEGRFPAGKANLNTACLAYDALVASAALAKDLGKPGASTYLARAEHLRQAIEKVFGAEVEGFHTYRYYEGNTVLRAWICTPLTMGITNRIGGTLDALFSPRLWTIDGLATQAGEKTFWDRATLYGFRGALQVGETARVMPYLMEYVRRRTLGEHVPYAIEAWPEGNQRHLSAESALFVRVFTEGLFGLKPTGLRSFDVLPRLPSEWPEMSLEKVWIAGKLTSFEVKRKGTRVELIVRGLGEPQRFEVGSTPIHVKVE